MRLIDADALEEKIKEWLTPSKYDEDEFITVTDALVSTMMTIEEQPTAYDLDKVIGGLYGLKRYKNKYDSYYENSMYQMTKIKNDTINSTIDEVIKIVKAGGIE